MIKAVIFDFDHTLYDRDGVYRNLLPAFHRYFGERLNTALSSDQMVDMLGLADRHCAYTTGWKGIVSELCRVGFFRTPVSSAEYAALLYREFPLALSIPEDVVPALKALKQEGYLLGILTTGNIRFQRDKLEHSPFPALCDSMLVASEVGCSKPHPKCFLAICEQLGIQPWEAVFVGDNPISDICGAKGVDMIPVWKRYLDTYPENLRIPEYVIDSIGEMPALMKIISEREKT